MFTSAETLGPFRPCIPKDDLRIILVQVISAFFLIGIVFVPVGVGCLVSALQVGVAGPQYCSVLDTAFWLVVDVRRLWNERLLGQVVEVTRRYDDFCIAGANNAAREATLMQV